MSKQALSDSQIIQNEYLKISNAWLRIHCLVLVWMIVSAVVAEILLYFVLPYFHQIPGSPIQYFKHYLFIPLTTNLIFLCIAVYAKHSKRMNDNLRTFIVSLNGSGVALMLYTVRHIFPGMTLVLTIPVGLTILYGRVRLTGMVGLICLFGKIGLDLFVHWDPIAKPDTFAGMNLINYLLTLFLLMVFYLVCMIMVWLDRQRIDFSVNMALEQQHLREKAITDALTQVGNRRALSEAIQRMQQSPDSQWYFVMMDMDSFKRINDQLGHGQGDRYLQILGEVLLQHESESFQAFRFGGDEFCAIIQGGTAQDAVSLCWKLQLEYTRAVSAESGADVGISIGVTPYYSGEPASQLVERADSALYQAKSIKNNVFLYQ